VNPRVGADNVEKTANSGNPISIPRPSSPWPVARPTEPSLLTIDLQISKTKRDAEPQKIPVCLLGNGSNFPHAKYRLCQGRMKGVSMSANCRLE
jgi:hypothetical protein